MRTLVAGPPAALMALWALPAALASHGAEGQPAAPPPSPAPPSICPASMLDCQRHMRCLRPLELPHTGSTVTPGALASPATGYVATPVQRDSTPGAPAAGDVCQYV